MGAFGRARDQSFHSRPRQVAHYHNFRPHVPCILASKIAVVIQCGNAASVIILGSCNACDLYVFVISIYNIFCLFVFIRCYSNFCLIKPAISIIVVCACTCLVTLVCACDYFCYVNLLFLLNYIIL